MASWFVFSGVPDDPSDPLNYTMVGAEPTTCSGVNQICAIYVASSGSLPIINCDVKDEMISALINRSDIPGSVLLKN